MIYVFKKVSTLKFRCATQEQAEELTRSGDFAWMDEEPELVDILEEEPE